MRGCRHNRREFLASTGAALAGSRWAAGAAPGEVAGPMKITRVESVRFRKDLKIGGGSGGADGADFWWVRLHTDAGFVGTGETYPFEESEIGALQSCADLLIGKDARDLDGLWRELYHRGAMRNAGGAEMRVLSAVNMAQMDILGQSSGLPLYRLLGGRTRSGVRVYNTTTDYWAINDLKMGPDTREIVDFLLERKITAMKIYPFRGAGDFISAEELERGLAWIRDIREHAGERMDICVDCWGRWDLPSAQRIARALEPHNILYLEDVMLSGNAESYAQLARETSVPICMSETLATRYEYREFLEAKACDVVMFDLSWAGGVSEARKIADLAESYLIPVSPHTCGGPLLYICSCHLCTAVPNFLIMESNYWKYTHQYPYFVENTPVPDDGKVQPPDLPGIGAKIREEIFRSGDAQVSTIAEA